ncbi:radical SAM family heme chaperone HemW [Synechococcus elongatus IITB4]|uniref:radical SAM family heme chaperone HemW n=1 Tax=Synechococcus elongatus TaxID=32046 RepID=UPI0030CC48FB
MTNLPIAAYLHIPFCRRRCFYCDFPISVVGDRLRGDQSGMIRQYVDALCQEIAATPVLGPALQTIFFGGGTPSLLSPNQLDRILQALDRRFGIAATAEISIEMDPASFDRSQAIATRQLGFNRVSIGAQAFQDGLLECCGRTHRRVDIDRAVADVRAAGFENLSLDLISGLPGQTLADWQASLEAAIALEPTHLSAYDLVLEPETVFGKRYQPGDRPLQADEQAAAMYQLTHATLEAAGFEHYEISNYARSGFQCRHNRVYWQNDSFYGFGVGATSALQGQRFSRPRRRADYFAWLETPGAIAAAADTVSPDPADALAETLMLGLRLAEGLAWSSLEQQFGAEFLRSLQPVIQRYQQAGWLQWQGDRLSLTQPEGMLFSNQVLASLFERLDAIAAI